MGRRSATDNGASARGQTRGSDPGPCVIVGPGAAWDETQVIAFARERLAGFETPKRIVAMDSFPETVGGKILKYKLRGMLAGQPA